MKKRIGQVIGIRSFVSTKGKKCRVFYVVAKDVSERDDTIGKECVEILVMEPDESFNENPSKFLDTYVEYVSVGGRNMILEYNVEV